MFHCIDMEIYFYNLLYNKLKLLELFFFILFKLIVSTFFFFYNVFNMIFNQSFLKSLIDNFPSSYCLLFSNYVVYAYHSEI